MKRRSVSGLLRRIFNILDGLDKLSFRINLSGCARMVVRIPDLQSGGSGAGFS
jgi:hypothetical protein